MNEAAEREKLALDCWHKYQRLSENDKKLVDDLIDALPNHNQASSGVIQLADYQHDKHLID